MVLPIKLCYITPACSSINEMVVMSKDVKAEEKEKTKKPQTLFIEVCHYRE